MQQVVFCFDLNHLQMKALHLAPADVNEIYGHDIPKAMKAAGLQIHLQGSVYASYPRYIAWQAFLEGLESALREHVPAFEVVASRAHLILQGKVFDVLEEFFGRRSAPMGQAVAPLFELDDEVRVLIHPWLFG